MAYQYPSEEEVLYGIPMPEVEDELILIHPEHVGGSVYRYMAQQQTVRNYYTYLKALEEAGFTKIGGVDKPEGRSVITATYQKGNRVVGTNYNFFWRRINLTFQFWPELPYTGTELYQEIPALPGAGLPEDVGANNYMLTAKNTTKADYDSYLSTLENAGFTLFANNGDEGLGGHVYNASYIKDNISISVTHFVRTETTYVSAVKDLPFSDHLHYDPDEVAVNPDGAKTTLHMPEHYIAGGSTFIIQLKSGHFIIQDGGLPNETRYLLDYLEELSGGSKPIIDAWFITHPHRDHTGVLLNMAFEEGHAERVIVEGIYFNEPSGPVVDFDCGARGDVQSLHEVSKILKRSTGANPQIYRTRTGERYYFNDVTAEMIFAQEQLPKEAYSGDVNDSSTWALFIIEGQKVLLGGDGDVGGMAKIMEIYPGEYLDSDVFSSLHHCHNTTDKFTDYFMKKTILVTCKFEPQMHKAQNDHLRDIAEEWFLYGEGTRILTFPYRVGESKVREHNTWKYHQGN